MSTCISRHGEYSAHVFSGGVLSGDEFVCDRCSVEDTDALRTALDGARLALQSLMVRNFTEPTNQLTPRKIGENEPDMPDGTSIVAHDDEGITLTVERDPAGWFFTGSEKRADWLKLRAVLASCPLVYVVPAAELRRAVSS